MKKIIFFLLIAIMPYLLYAQADIGMRYLKLGNSHRVAKNFNSAKKYLDLGIKIAKQENNKYWEAAGYELLAYYYCDIDDKNSALEYLNQAKAIYGKVTKAPVDGSHKAIDDVIDYINNNGCPCSSNPNNSTIFISTHIIIKVYNFDNSRLNQLPPMDKDATNLSLAGNRFPNIPSGLSEYKLLDYLNIPNNRIRDLTGIGSLTNLHYLNLSGNRISEIPDEIENLQNLFELDLSNNRIKKVNTGITKLKNLKILNLKGNKIPFVELKRIIQALPNTNIIHDLYIQK